MGHSEALAGATVPLHLHIPSLHLYEEVGIDVLGWAVSVFHEVGNVGKDSQGVVFCLPSAPSSPFFFFGLSGMSEERELFNY